jgi:phosphoserine phosphatase
MSLHDAVHQARIFVADNLDALLRKDAPAWLEKMRDSEILLLSTSSDFLVQAVADHLNSRLSLSMVARGTTYNVDGMFFKSVAEIFDGFAKRAFLHDFIEKKGLSQSAITVYSDSILDLPLFEAAASCVAVAPDRRLRAVANERSWTILEG